MPRNPKSNPSSTRRWIGNPPPNVGHISTQHVPAIQNCEAALSIFSRPSQSSRGFWKMALQTMPPPSTNPPPNNPARYIGPYKLVEEIGEGGMGSVFMALQKEPVRRKVALKIIKPGMDSKQVVSRFEAERQALAMMDHPNIARVFDGGATESGRPYFVMELVKGIPITDYCDRSPTHDQ